MADNLLYYGDNLSIMRTMPKYSVDLIYLDPPFKSEQTYNLIYKTLTGKPVPEQAEAFCDTWDMDAEKERLADRMPVLMQEHGVEDYYVEFWRLWIKALRHTQPHLLAYLIYMVERLLQMKSILKPTGSIYLHCDPTASHYIKVMMDGIFGHDNFRNEIIWKRTSGHSDAKGCGRVHDVILYYTMGSNSTWNRTFQSYDPEYVEAYYRYKEPSGRRFMSADLSGAGQGPPRTFGDRGEIAPPSGRHWMFDQAGIDRVLAEDRIYWTRNGVPRLKKYLDEAQGMPLQDVWTDIQALRSWHKERLGYPTQKPKGLLDRIIRASTNEGDVVFDPFCGCGTTIYAAHEAKRRWIGCDVAILAVRLVEDQLAEQYGLVKEEHYEEKGIPNSVESAKALWSTDPFQFEHWAVEKVGGFPTKKTGDKGIDGRMYFEMKRELGVMVLSVKGGTVRPTDVRDLRGVLGDDPSALLAGFVTIKKPSKGMIQAANEAGIWEYNGIHYPRVQMLTVQDILETKRRFMTPTKLGTRALSEQTRLPV